jgi:hypothetical protein
MARLLPFSGPRMAHLPPFRSSSLILLALAPLRFGLSTLMEADVTMLKNAMAIVAALGICHCTHHPQPSRCTTIS